MGYKISRVRELFGYQQNELAVLCDWSQQQMSKIELSEHVEEHIITQVAVALKTSPDVIKNFNEEQVISNINNTYTNSTHNQHYRPVINGTVDEVKAYIARIEEAEQQKQEQFSQFAQVVVELAAQVTDLTARVGDLAAQVEALQNQGKRD